MTQALDPHSQAADAVHEGRPVEAQYVRQGRRGAHVVWILATSLVLVVVAFLVVWGLHMGPFAATEDSPQAQAAEASDFNTPADPPIRQRSGS